MPYKCHMSNYTKALSMSDTPDHLKPEFLREHGNEPLKLMKSAFATAEERMQEEFRVHPFKTKWEKCVLHPVYQRHVVSCVQDLVHGDSRFISISSDKNIIGFRTNEVIMLLIPKVLDAKRQPTFTPSESSRQILSGQIPMKGIRLIQLPIVVGAQLDRGLRAKSELRVLIPKESTSGYYEENISYYLTDIDYQSDSTISNPDLFTPEAPVFSSVKTDSKRKIQ